MDWANISFSKTASRKKLGNAFFEKAFSLCDIIFIGFFAKIVALL